VKYWFFALFVLVMMVVAMHDIANEPRDSYTAHASIAAIDVYRTHVSPHLKGVVTCRFTPSCSAYGREAIRRYGFARGAWMTAKRVLRCGPWTRAGTVDRP
jgi:putative membrane protein insertion efficiency factor